MSVQTKRVDVGNVAIGGGAPVSVQSMTNTKTSDVPATIEQIKQLEEAGCDIVRLAVPDFSSAKAFEKIKSQVQVPLVADIHFNYKLALAAVDAGADKIRINPGNIGSIEKVEKVVSKTVAHHIPIRVGVNSGSIEKDILRQEGGATVSALVKSALKNIKICQDLGAKDLVLSLKSSDVLKTIAAYEKVSAMTDVPLHIGVTEAGTARAGTIKSSVALGILLSEDIGDTLRVSLTGDPVQEIYVGKQILKSLNLTEQGLSIISCPTCGRTKVDLEAIVNQVEHRLNHLQKSLTVAIMGCEVNGPGEAREADIGIACGRNSAVLFKKGKIVRKISEENIVGELIEEILSWDDAAQ